MSLNDPISDLLTRIRNACLRKHKQVKIPHSRMKLSIAKLLCDEGFIVSVKEIGKEIGKEIELVLKYTDSKESVIRKLVRISKPGLRIYKDSKNLKPQIGGQGLLVVSTSQGLLSDMQCRQKNIGGEVLCLVY